MEDMVDTEVMEAVVVVDTEVMVGMVDRGAVVVVDREVMGGTVGMEVCILFKFALDHNILSFTKVK
jgi:hypothetical protein